MRGQRKEEEFTEGVKEKRKENEDDDDEDDDALWWLVGYMDTK